MIALSQEVSTCLSLDKLTIKVNGILNRLVLDRENLDALHNLVEEEFSKYVIRDATRTLLP